MSTSDLAAVRAHRRSGWRQIAYLAAAARGEKYLFDGTPVFNHPDANEKILEDAIRRIIIGSHK